MNVRIYLGTVGLALLAAFLPGSGGSRPASAAPAQTLTYLDLVKRLTDLEQLAVLPAPGETCAQCSSYDRRSRYDAATGKYVEWSANGDGTGFIRAEGEQVVMAEMEEPGCIWRIWSARAEAGHVKIYLDGNAEPAVDLPFSGYFDGKNAPFTSPALVHNAARGLNSYVPIPYRKSCKVVADKGWGRYFHFTYETFPQGTVVPAFRRELSPAESAALAAADKTLREGLGKDPAGDRPGQAVESKKAAIPAGQTAVLAKLDGPRAITALQVKLPPMGREEEIAALRELVLRITWDGEAQPAVWTPLGDFFGSAPGANRYRSLPLGMTEDGFYSLWYMPFARQALVEVVNEGKAARALEYRIVHAPLTRPASELGRFHAKWHRDAFLPAEPERAIDWTMLKTSGRGRFLGVTLNIWNPRGGWWGEGDEKFFVDGEKFPSTFGTGSEDYFGYAWSNPELFQNAYHNQTISEGNRGHISVNRWQIADNVPFHTSFEGAIGKYWANEKPTRYDATSYWYLAPGGSDPYLPVPLDQRVGYWTTPPPAPPAFTEKGALEGEQLKVLERTAGNARTQDLRNRGDQWSGGAQLWWTDAKPGDHLTLALPVAQAGRQSLTLQFTKAPDYGIVQLSLDGEKLGDPIDLYAAGVAASGPIALGARELTPGEHKLGVEITGANEKALKRYMFGLDWMKLEPAK